MAVAIQAQRRIHGHRDGSQDVGRLGQFDFDLNISSLPGGGVAALAVNAVALLSELEQMDFLTKRLGAR